MKGGGPSEGLEARATKVRACPQQHCTLGLHPRLCVRLQRTASLQLCAHCYMRLLYEHC